MRDVEGLEKYERGVFHSKSAMSRVAKELEDFAVDYVPFQSYGNIHVTSFRHI